MNYKILVVVLLLFLPFVSAEIIIEDTFDHAYSVGDLVWANFSLQKQADSSGYLETVLECGESNLLVSKQYINVYADDKKWFDYEFPANLVGNCVFRVDYGDETARSEDFSIGDGIDISFFVSAKEAYPGDKILINGTAEMYNGDGLEGTIKIYSEGIVDRVFEVDGGKFDLDFFVQEDAPAGNYTIFIEALDKDVNEEIINSGKVNFNFKVKQEPREIVVSSPEQIGPPGNLSFSYKLVDQNQSEIGGENLLLKVFDPNLDLVEEESLDSVGKYSYYFEDSAINGAWSFNFYYGNIFFSRQIFVGENPQVSAFIVVDSGKSYLRIVNEGNVAYRGVVMANLDGEKEENIPINVDLGVGDSMDYELKYTGNYNLSFQGEDLGSVTLTGASVGVDWNIRWNSYWYILAIVIGGLVIYVGVRNKQSLENLLKARKEKPDDKMYEQTFDQRENIYSGQRAYIAFFRFDRDFEELSKISIKYGWSVRKVKEGEYFVLFYSSRNGPDKKLLDFVREVFEKATSARVGVGASIHTDRLERKEGFLKDFSAVAKKLLSFSKNEILVSKNFLSGIKGLTGSVRYFEVGDKIIEAYSI